MQALEVKSFHIYALQIKDWCFEQTAYSLLFVRFKKDHRDRAITVMCRHLKLKNTEDPDVGIHSKERDLIPFPMVPYFEISTKCFISHRPVSCDGGSVGRGKKKE